VPERVVEDDVVGRRAVAEQGDRREVLERRGRAELEADERFLNDSHA